MSQIETKKKKGDVVGRPTENWPASEIFAPVSALSDRNVDIKVISDDPAYDPASNFTGGVWMTLKAKLGARLPMAHRATATIDCGVSVNLPAGFNVKAIPIPELAVKGLFVNTATLRGDRLSIIVTNIGKEIVVLEDKQPFAQVAVEASYLLNIKRD